MSYDNRYDEDFELPDSHRRTPPRPRRQATRDVVERTVRRHDVPDPTPTPRFEEPEVVTSTMTERRRTVDLTDNAADSRQRPERQARAPRNENFDDEPQRRTERPERPERKAAPQRRQDSRTRRPNGRQGGVVGFFKDRRLHIFIGITMMLAGAVLATVLISHLRSAGADQSRVLSQTVEQIAASGEPTSNWAGAFGAWISKVMFADALGLGAFVVSCYLVVVGACLCARRQLNFWAFTFKSLLLAVTISVVAGLVTYTADSEVFWGGTHGHYVNKYLMDHGSYVLSIAVSLLLIAAVVCVYYYPLKKGASMLAALKPVRRPDDLSDETSESAEKDMPKARTAVTTPAAVSQDLAVVRIDDDDDYVEEPVTTAPQPDDAQSIVIDDDAPVASVALTTAPKQPKAAATATGAEATFEVEVAQGDDQQPDASNQDADNAAADASETDPYDHRAECSRFEMPPLTLLEERPQKDALNMEELQENKDRIVKTLADYRIEIASIKATVGPTVTLYEIVPADGVRIASIKRVENDIARSLAAEGIRVIAPIPGKSTVGIEVPNKDKQTVSMRRVLASRKFQDNKKALPVALGATISNEIFVADLASMPHALVAGATGQGKSVGLNAIIASLLYKKHPTELKFVLIDPKQVEFSLYSKLQKHYLAQLPEDEDAIITEPDRVLAVLNSLCVEMDNRLSLLRDAGVRDIESYNRRFTERRLNPANGHRYMPYIVVIIDEFADLIMTAGKDIEQPVMRITQKARAVGIHMIIATQRPSTNVLTGLIKANCPTRIAFRVMQMVDSRTILDAPGANQLIGRGDMLYSAGGLPERVQCAFISTEEVEHLVDYIDEQPGCLSPYFLPEPMAPDNGGAAGAIAAGGMDRDPLFDEAARYTVQQASASTSSLQRRYQIGYNRAGKIMDQMEAAGIVGPASGSKPRTILIGESELENLLSQFN